MRLMCCVGCAGARLMLGGRDHVIEDARGRLWKFEMHPYCGPIVLGRAGDPKTVQPGSRSPFWPAFKAWQQRQQKSA